MSIATSPAHYSLVFQPIQQTTTGLQLWQCKSHCHITHDAAFFSFGVLGFFSFFSSVITYCGHRNHHGSSNLFNKNSEGGSTLNTHSVPLPQGSRCCLALYRQGRSTRHSTDIWTRNAAVATEKLFPFLHSPVCPHFIKDRLTSSTRLEKPRRPAYYLLFSTA